MISFDYLVGLKIKIENLETKERRLHYENSKAYAVEKRVKLDIKFFNLNKRLQKVRGDYKLALLEYKPRKRRMKDD
tara:strand:+ start:218 stop:445 length:228 start_codon:yes stop_codon:yes gene_type:complete